MDYHRYGNQFDVTWLIEAGLYEIVNTSSRKRYIGHTENPFERLGKHVSTLNDGTHDCQQLQKDWTGKPGDFSFKVLQIGDQWRDKKTRVEEEKRILATCSTDQVYNVRTVYIEEHQMYRLKIRVNNLLYSSMKEAVRALNTSETRLRRRLKSDKFPEYQVLEYISHGYRKVVVDNKSYPTVNSLVAEGLVGTRQQAIYRLPVTQMGELEV